MDITEQELQGLYTWVDEIPLSRPKRNIARDFSDGVMMAEIIAYYFPKLVALHNYSAANGTPQKMYNWNTLNQKVFKRLGFTMAKLEMEAICNCQPGAIERLLKLVQFRIAKLREEGIEDLLPHVPVVPRVATLAPHHQYRTSEEGDGERSALPRPTPASPASAKPRRSSANRAAPSPAAPHYNAHAVRSQESIPDREYQPTENDLRETIEILEAKIRKMETLVSLKDAKISTLTAKLTAAGLG